MAGQDWATPYQLLHRASPPMGYEHSASAFIYVPKRANRRRALLESLDFATPDEVRDTWERLTHQRVLWPVGIALGDTTTTYVMIKLLDSNGQVVAEELVDWNMDRVEFPPFAKNTTIVGAFYEVQGVRIGGHSVAAGVSFNPLSVDMGDNVTIIRGGSQWILFE